MRFHLLVSFLLLISYTASSQSNWTAIMTNSTSQQSYNTFSTLDEVQTYILEKAKEGKALSEIVYGDGKWLVVATQTPVKTTFSWQWDTKFPSEWISQEWKAKKHISKVTWGNGNWFVVTTDQSEYVTQTWATRYTWDEINTFIKSKWDENTRYNITDIAYANGMWCVVLSIMKNYEKQTYKVSEKMPMDWIQEKYNEGYNVTSIESDGEKWYVVMTKAATQKGETLFNPETQFPRTKVKEQWDKDRRISSIVFRDATKSNANLFKEYKQQGDDKLGKKDYIGAISAYDKAIELSPSDEGSLNNRAWAKYLAGYCYSAINDINKAIEIQSTHYNNHTKASILKCQNKCAEAIPFYNEAVRLYKLQYGKVNDIVYYVDRAEAKKCIGNYDGAKEDLDLALAIEPNNASIKKNLSDITQLLTQNSKPVISWDYPIDPSLQTMSSSVTIKACISSKSSIKKKTIILNGTELTAESKALGVESDCTDFVTQSIFLRTGENEVYIKVQTASGAETISERRKFIYSPATRTSNYYALFVAVEEYDDPAINPLNDRSNRSIGPVAELKRLKEVLVSKYDFPESNIKFLSNPDKEDITSALTFFNNLKPTDNFLLVYSGHGDTLGKAGFWLPKDAVKSKRKNFLSVGELNDYLQNINTKHTLVIADACYSGMLLQQGNKSTEQVECSMANDNTGYTALTSGALTPVPNSNVFMNLLTRLLNESSSCITSEKLYFLLKQNMLAGKMNIQNPQYGMLRLDMGSGGLQMGGHFTFFKK